MGQTTTRRFVGYPVDRLLAVFDDPVRAATVASELMSADIAATDIHPPAR